MFPKLRAIFWTRRWPNLCTGAVFWALFTFFFFSFCCKKCPTNWSKHARPKKSLKIGSGGGPGPPKSTKNRHAKTWKIETLQKKTNFLRGRFFSKFWVAKKLVKRGHNHFWSTNCSGTWGLWGRIKEGASTKTTQGKQADYLTRHWAKGPANYYYYDYPWYLLILP